jgi:hypothetical protein
MMKKLRTISRKYYIKYNVAHFFVFKFLNKKINSHDKYSLHREPPVGNHYFTPSKMHTQCELHMLYLFMYIV